MNRQIGFRHALAAAQLLFYLAVTGYSQYARHRIHSSTYDPFSLTGGGAHEWVQICAIVNAPAVMAFGWIGRELPPSLTWIAIILTGAGIFAQWYLVGLWRDESSTLLQSEHPTIPALATLILWWLGLVAASLVGLLSVAVQIFLFKTSNAFLISLAIWCGFFAAFLLRRIQGKGRAVSDGSVFKI
jgi:hypothetical protein